MDILWICDKKNGGCGYIGSSNNWDTSELIDEKGFVISSVSYCPNCGEDSAVGYKPKECDNNIINFETTTKEKGLHLDVMAKDWNIAQDKKDWMVISLPQKKR